MFDNLSKIMTGVAGGAGTASHLTDVPAVAVVIANFFLIVGMGLSLVSIALSFIQFASSSGDPERIEKAQQGLLWAAIGFVLAILAWTVKSVIIRAFGAEDNVY